MSIEGYQEKWMIRHDLHPEQFKGFKDFSREHVEYLKKIGNYFETREDAVATCNALRLLLKLPLLEEKIYPEIKGRNERVAKPFNPYKNNSTS